MKKKEIDLLKELDEVLALKTQNSKELVKAVTLALAIDDLPQQYNSLQRVSEAFKDIKLSAMESNQVIQLCTTIYQAAYLFTKSMYNVYNQPKMRETVKSQVESKDPYEIFQINKMNNCKTQEELTPLAAYTQCLIDLILDMSEDSYYFSQIFHVILKALCLTTNIRTLGKDKQIQRVCQRLVTIIETRQDLYFWQTLMETIVQAGNLEFVRDALIQPAVVGRILLSKIACITDIYKYLGRYLIWSVGIEFEFVKSYISMGPSYQALVFIKLVLTDLYSLVPLDQKKEPQIPPLIRAANTGKLLALLTDSLFIKFQQNFRVILEILSLIINQTKFQDEKILGDIDKILNDQVEKVDRKYEIKDFYAVLPQFATEQLPMLTKQFKRPSQPYQLRPLKSVPEKCVGMKNLFNSCYLNSFLQALSLTQRFVYVLQNFPLDKTNFFTEDQTLKNTLINWAKFMSSMQFKVEFSPIQLKRQLREPYRSELNQQDAGEFGAHLFDDLERQIKPDEYQLIKQLFVGRQQAKLECCKCNKSTEGPLEEFIQLSLNLIQTTSTAYRTTLRQLLDNYLASETLKYKCDHCNQSGDNQKNIKLKEMPECLIIQLNRFHYKNNQRIKVHEPIEIAERLTIGTLPYKIYAVIAHVGLSVENGHYLVYGQKEDLWYRFDDSDVSLIGSYDQVKLLFNKENTPYLLFYQKQQ